MLKTTNLKTLLKTLIFFSIIKEIKNKTKFFIFKDNFKAAFLFWKKNKIKNKMHFIFLNNLNIYNIELNRLFKINNLYLKTFSYSYNFFKLNSFYRNISIFFLQNSANVTHKFYSEISHFFTKFLFCSLKIYTQYILPIFKIFTLICFSKYFKNYSLKKKNYIFLNFPKTLSFQNPKFLQTNLFILNNYFI